MSDTTKNPYNIFSFSTPAKAFVHLPLRRDFSNKGDYGRVLCICGSYGMSGAAYLCAKAAYRTGAGLVEILTHESNRTILQTLLPEAVVSTYSDAFEESAILDCIGRADVIVMGCGLGISSLSRKLVSTVLHSNDDRKTPLLLDADALNIVSRNPSFLKYMRGTVITPHPKEMSRLLSCELDEITQSISQTAFEYAQKHSLICLLKDHRTAVSDGNSVYVNITGNSGMATGGSGDVLSGIIGGLLAQRKNGSSSIFDLTCLGAYLHGLCGDAAAKNVGKYSLMASDIIDALPTEINKYTYK